MLAIALLLATAPLLVALILGTLCAPMSNAGSAGGCAATIFVAPFASILSPLVGVSALVQILSARVRLRPPWRHHRARTSTVTLSELPSHAATGGTHAARAAYCGRLCRAHALWNATSIANALIALFALATLRAPFALAGHWLLAFTLLIAKLLLSHAMRVLGAGVGLTRPARLLLNLFDERRASRAYDGPASAAPRASE